MRKPYCPFDSGENGFIASRTLIVWTPGVNKPDCKTEHYLNFVVQQNGLLNSMCGRRRTKEFLDQKVGPY